VKVYPFVRRTPRWEYCSDNALNIEVAKLSFTDASSVSYTFKGGTLAGGGYSSIPTVTATSVEIAASDPQGADVNVFVSAVTQYVVTLSSSHAFTGEVHIQIIWMEGI
jgi:hypothetical protein